MPIPAEQFKQALIIRLDLKMSCGKIAAQCCHAATSQFVDKRVILQCADLAELEALELKAQAISQKLPIGRHLSTFRITDAERTEVPASTVTVLSILGFESDVDLITSPLKLLK